MKNTNLLSIRKLIISAILIIYISVAISSVFAYSNIKPESIVNSPENYIGQQLTSNAVVISTGYEEDNTTFVFGVWGSGDDPWVKKSEDESTIMVSTTFSGYNSDFNNYENEDIYVELSGKIISADDYILKMIILEDVSYKIIEEPPSTIPGFSIIITLASFVCIALLINVQNKNKK